MQSNNVCYLFWQAKCTESQVRQSQAIQREESRKPAASKHLRKRFANYKWDLGFCYKPYWEPCKTGTPMVLACMFRSTTFSQLHSICDRTAEHHSFPIQAVIVGWTAHMLIFNVYVSISSSPPCRIPLALQPFDKQLVWHHLVVRLHIY